MRHKLTKRFLAAAVALPIGAVLLALAAFSPLHGGTPANEEAARALPVAATPVVSVSSYPVVRRYTGELRAARTAELAFELPGRVIELHVDVGQRVSAGEDLAQLCTKQILAEHRALRARFEAASAELAELEAGPRDEVIAAARAEVRQLTAELELAELQLSRRTDLVTAAVESQADLDIATAQRRTVAARLDRARSHLAELTAGTRAERLLAQRARVAELQAAIDGVDVRIGKSRLVAPFAGTVAARLIDEGTVVGAGQSALRLSESGRLEAWIGVPAEGSDPVDTSAEHRLQVGEARYRLPVARVLPEIDERTRTLTLVFDLPANATARIHPGQIVRLVTEQEVQAQGFEVPLTALVASARGLWSCLVIEADPDVDANGEAVARVARAEVEVLHVMGDQAVVRGTLQAGDLVVVGGAQRVAPGQLVEPLIRP